MVKALEAGAQHYYASGQFREGLDAYLLLYEFEQVPSAGTWRGIGLCKMGLGLSDEAEAALRMALRRDPEQEEAICAELAKLPDEPAARLAEQICNDY
jgi:tetratricopeptide (TPR) repeat protein